MEQYNWPQFVDALNQYLRLKTPPLGIKLCETREEMMSIPKVRLPKEGEVFSACQLVGQALRLNYTIGITAEHLPSVQCMAVLGLCARDKLLATRHLTGAWFGNDDATAAHQEAMYHFDRTYEAAVVSPLASNRLPQPNACLVYGTPQQVMLLANAIQYKEYEVIDARFVGESSCSDSWTRCMVTDKPCIALPCFGERRYGGILDDEMVIAFPPRYAPRIVDGLMSLSKNGLRYPAPFYGVQHDITAGLGKSYSNLAK